MIAQKGANQVWSWDITYLPSPWARSVLLPVNLIEDSFTAAEAKVGWEYTARICEDRSGLVCNASILSEKMPA